MTLLLALAAFAQDQAVTFPGALDHVLLGAIDPGSSYTVEMWARLDLVGEETFVCTADAAYVSTFCVQYRTDYWMAEINDDDAIEADTCDEPHPHVCLPEDLAPAPATRHVAVTVTPERMALWVDGVQRAAAVTGQATRWTDVQWALGIDAEPAIAPDPAGWNNDKLDGLLDEVRIWDHVRSAEEMACTRNWALTGVEDGLVALWHFDAAPGGISPDATGNGHDGQLVNTAALVASPFALVPSVGGDVPCLDFDLDGLTPDEGDCDDLDPTVHAGAVDTPDDGIDQDCANGDPTTRLKGGLAECGCAAVAPGSAWALLPLLGALRRRRPARRPDRGGFQLKVKSPSWG